SGAFKDPPMKIARRLERLKITTKTPRHVEVRWRCARHTRTAAWRPWIFQPAQDASRDGVCPPALKVQRLSRRRAHPNGPPRRPLYFASGAGSVEEQVPPTS